MSSIGGGVKFIHQSRVMEWRKECSGGFVNHDLLFSFLTKAGRSGHLSNLPVNRSCFPGQDGLTFSRGLTASRHFFPSLYIIVVFFSVVCLY